MNRKHIALLTFCMSLGLFLGALLIAPTHAVAQTTCTVSTDCDDGNGCTIDTCIGGTCATVTCVDFQPQPQCRMFVCNSTTPDATSACIVQADSGDNGSSCNDGVSCTINDQCLDGICAGTPDDGSCANGAFCDGAETCEAGSGCIPGEPVVFDDGVSCTDDSCDEVNDVVVNAPNDGNCDNGQFCDGAETCDAVNNCQAGTPPATDDGVSCTDDSCDDVNDVIVNTVNDGSCDNGQFCDGSETCDAVNDCLAGTPPSTNDGVACTDDSCDEVNDVIVNTANDGNCDNGQFCDGSETCDAVNDCQAGTPPSANDGVACTDDSCDEVNDVIVNTANDGNCDNGQFCDGSETCDAVNDCLAGTPPSTNDGVACTDDSCDELNDVVVNDANDANCDNGQFCDGSETCDAVSDCQAGAAPSTNDGVSCTDDSCDEVNDVIVNAPNDGNCDNSQFCDGSETCDAVSDCQAGTAPTIDDGVACTDDSCDEINDVVVNAANDANCDNAQFCDGAETCDAVNDCLAGIAPTTDDGVACTDDSCDEINDVVVNAANDANCDNGEFCDGAETCDEVSDCQAGTAPTIDDGVACTDDSCDEINDVVVNAPNDTSCDNGSFCDGAETCDAVNDCQPGTAPTTDDGVACTDDSCDEVNDVIVNATNDANCDNGQFCDGAETCDAVNDCLGGIAPTTDDGVACTDDSCDEVNDVVVNVANDASCDNGTFCDGAETCDAVNDCQPGTPVDCSGLDDMCETGVCDEIDGECVAEPMADGTLCSDGDSCSRLDQCFGGECLGVDRCGDANVDGEMNILDCLQIIVHGVGGSGVCAPDSCDLTGDCRTTIVDALSCLHCVVGLPTCQLNCPTAVGFSEDNDDGPYPLYESAIFGVDYSFAPGKFCKAAGEAICAPLVNQIDPFDELLTLAPEFLGTQIFPTLDLAALNPDPSGFYGPHYTQCYFWIDPLSPANPLDEGDFSILGGNLGATAVPVGAGPAVPLSIHPEICPTCGDGVCNPLDDEDPFSCQADCGVIPF